MKRLLFASIFLLAGCRDGLVTPHVDPVDTVEVKVPVMEKAPAPAELFRTKIAADSVPFWVVPSNPAATSCLTAKDEGKTQVLLSGRETMLDGWEAWAK